MKTGRKGKGLREPRRELCQNPYSALLQSKAKKTQRPPLWPARRGYVACRGSGPRVMSSAKEEGDELLHPGRRAEGLWI